jgi:hypothetical protein
MSSADASKHIARTRAGAADALRAARDTYFESIAAEELAAVINNQLIDELIDVAWRHQFDDERESIQRLIREMVGDRVEAVVEERTKTSK